jgi:myo-inositol-1(or 4)-monophosphatase
MTDHEVAIALVEIGAAVVRKRFGTALQHTLKGDHDFATEADFESERAMLDRLRRWRPEDAVLAEESGRSGSPTGARLWLIDPLCGTLNYAAGTRLVAVNAALQERKALTAAAVADPFSGEIFWTDGQRAFLRLNDRDTPLTPGGSSKLVELDVETPSSSASGFRIVDLTGDTQFTAQFQPRIVSTSLALTWVAAGRRAAYVADGDIRESVHFAAGLALCRAAGCKVTDLQGRPWGSGETGMIVAADRETHEAIRKIVAKRV